MQLAIIGAGIAGLVAARTLHQRRPDLAITLYEQRAEPGGRVASRRCQGCVFDYGAQYLSTPSADLLQLITKDIPSDELHDIGMPVWTFDRLNHIAPGDELQNAAPKWIYRSGLDQLAWLLAAGLDIRYGTRVSQIRSMPASTTVSAGYLLYDGHGQPIGPADMVLWTQPAPELRHVLGQSDIAPHIRAQLLGELQPVRYRPCISMALNYDRPITRPFYALV